MGPMGSKEEGGVRNGRFVRVGLLVLGALASLPALGLGCADTDPVGECQVGADCPSGACSQGACVPVGEGGSGNGGGGAAGGGEMGGGSTGGTTGGGGTGNGPACAPNFDGTVERAEMPLGPGLSAKFLSAQDVSFNTSPTMEMGEAVWDLSVSFNGDQVTLATTDALDGAWYADTFPAADYVSRLSQSEDLLGVFDLTETELRLLGVVSPDDGLFATELEYDPPVTVLTFPISLGQTWQTSTSISGLAEGVFVLYSEDYESTVDTEGELRTPFGDFPVLRVGTTLDRTIGFVTTTTRQFAFVTECFGTVATVTSQDNPPADEFVDVAELRRLTP